MEIILTELFANKRNMFLATQMIKEQNFKQLGKKIINTVVTNEKSLKFICNCCVKYLIKKIAFYHSIYHKF